MGSEAVWVNKVMRWGQVNLQEDDPRTLDVAFWQRQWQRTPITWATINAGGRVA